ncbi:DUF4189 domain-containing protein [Lysobacter alkalisoli]|uniref:DUF4189 domain-containing protein n=1 Tax=Marilutibacter alkalisoli TaxID=2591633 RepID=A0A514BWY7_9GAMM|nr:DUF4189 domain-containing protein [Lysobacter alkalisoli]
MAYYNQCGVMVIGDNKHFTSSAGTPESAAEAGIKYCEKYDSNCEVYYSACTEPVFHRY